MNATMARFGYPDSVVREYEHWVVMIRPTQVTMGCTIIAAKSDCTSLGGLTRDEAAELPEVIRDFEAAINRIATASKFNYLALMMFDPNPHFHAIPRYANDVTVEDCVFTDPSFPSVPNLSRGHDLDATQLERLRRRVAQESVREF